MSFSCISFSSELAFLLWYNNVSYWFTTDSDIICTEAGTGRLVYMVAGGDYDDSVVLQSSLLHCAAPLHLSSSTQDAHLYVIKRWLLDYALNKE